MVKVECRQAAGAGPEHASVSFSAACSRLRTRASSSAILACMDARSVSHTFSRLEASTCATP